ncbi:MAG TPA: NUDIX domain-containing protein [Xanthobacteraceae bacterium]|jgi:ADP-ribose pyrophosphatase
MSGDAIIKRHRRNYDGFFKIDELDVSFVGGAGRTVEQTREVFERGDAVAALLLNLDSNSVVLVEQFRVPALIGRRRDEPASADGWMTETVAGMIDPGDETPEAAVIRETREETGYQIRHPRLIAKFFSSPGGSSERIFLYFAEVRDRDRVEKGGGLEDEDVKLVHLALPALLDRLAAGSIEDPKLLIAACWLRSHLQ